MTIHSCCEKTYLSEYGLKCNGCMSQEIIEKSPFLIGGNEDGDKTTEAKQKSWIISQNEQMTFI